MLQLALTEGSINYDVLSMDVGTNKWSSQPNTNISSATVELTTVSSEFKYDFGNMGKG